MARPAMKPAAAAAGERQKGRRFDGKLSIMLYETIFARAELTSAVMGDSPHMHPNWAAIKN